jgi:hypothetical protein
MPGMAGDSPVRRAVAGIGVLARCLAVPEPGEHGTEVITVGSACRQTRPERHGRAARCHDRDTIEPTASGNRITGREWVNVYGIASA